jgi:hypothetical protein
MRELSVSIIKALRKKYKGQMAEAEANIAVYMNNPAGIGEHPEILEAIDSQVAKYAEAEEKLQALGSIIDG